METQLFSLSKIFTERLFRIPDYQRGYAWKEAQLKDFWNDILQLEEGKNHYTGVLTLEKVDPTVYKTWHDDLWILESKSFKPFYVVDGQQRLTTVILLIQAIIERLKPGEPLNYSSKEEIQKKYIFDSRAPGVSRSYIFGYESDNPSYEFLKTRIFQEHSSTSSDLKETIYTTNLQNAKHYFAQSVSSLTVEQLENLFKKTSQHLLFNIFTIEEDVDVFVAFETMNNRGKPLSHLELLKNRLIYLSLKLRCDERERTSLRRMVNNCWKSVYHQLGRNKESPLDDDDFLRSHMIFHYPDVFFSDGDSSLRRTRHRDIAQYLLSDKFVTKNVRSAPDSKDHLTIGEFHSYIKSLQICAECWYFIHNPLDTASPFADEEKIWLDKLARLHRYGSTTLVLTALQKEKDQATRISFLTSLERFLFTALLTTRHYFLGEDTYKWIADLAQGKIQVSEVTARITDLTMKLTTDADFVKRVVTGFRNEGFYQWDGIRYFLYEYNLSLQQKSKTTRKKIHWAEFVENRADYVTVEHIYPQNPVKGDWPAFDALPQKHRKSLTQSIGNLLPLSQPKNSSLQNKPFREKVSGDKEYVGYRYGCYAENEVSNHERWTPIEVADRGLKLLEFIEERWAMRLGSIADKKRMLGVDFLEAELKLE